MNEEEQRQLGWVTDRLYSVLDSAEEEGVPGHLVLQAIRDVKREWKPES